MSTHPIPTGDLQGFRADMHRLHRADEASVLAGLCSLAPLTPEDRATAPGLMEAFLAEYGLSTDEGVALMCLAEALLRVPDAETIDA
jgi:RHH-type proline utilization regulon transcriptional repressor/proline dehydrogenase/delta 1-pyrroline-5-carboxylate dehydrogenase